MAGIVPKNKNTPGRKQWTLHDGPRGSLRQLRNQLANDGCPESQVVLAKQLLEEKCELNIDKKENARMGVYWLIKASEQGHSEATELLNKCLLTGHGITEHNYIDVKACINMTQLEKLARKAAREMFASLSNGEDFITSEQLQKRMLEIQNEQQLSTNKFEDEVNDLFSNGELVNNIDNDSESSEEETYNWAARNDRKNEKLTEDALVSAASSYSQGLMPLVNRVLCLTDPNLNALDDIPVLQRSVLHPILTLQIIYHKFLRFLEQRPIKSLFPFNRTDIQLFALVIYSLFSFDNVALFIPMLLYYGSLISMIIKTLQIVQVHQNFREFRIWSGLFITYSGGSLNATEAEIQFLRNNLKSYVHFFLAFLINLSVYPLSLQQWIPQSEITFIAFCLTFITLFSFGIERERGKKSPDLLIFFSFAVNVLAKYPYDTDAVVKQTWRFLDLKIPTFASYVVGNGIEFCLNFRLLFYVIIPIILMSLASRQNWRGTYKFLIPHCVTLSWLQIVLISTVEGATMFGLIRCTLALVGVVLFLPLLGLTTILLPAIAAAKWVVTNNNLYSLIIFVLLAALCYGISVSLTRTAYGKYLHFVQILVGLFFTGYVLVNFYNSAGEIKLIHGTPETKPMNTPISWEQYQNVCHQPAWDSTNVAQTQIYCQKLVDHKIHWNGYINQVKLKSVSNIYKSVFDRFPWFLRNYFYCYFGTVSDTEYDELNEVIKSERNVCRLDIKNIYEYEISVRMQSGIWGKSAEVFLIAGNDFKNFTLQLKSNDKIWFLGRLFNNEEIGTDGLLGGMKPHIHLTEIGCIACHNTNLNSFKLLKEDKTEFRSVFDMIFKIIKFVVNSLFNNIIIFK